MFRRSLRQALRHDDWVSKFRELAPYHITSCLPPDDAMSPKNKQKSHSGSCFILAPITTRQLLQKKYPSVFPHGELQESDVIRHLGAWNRMRHFFGLGLGGGSPVQAFQQVIGGTPNVIALDDSHIMNAIAPVKVNPCMLPYLPPMGRGSLVHIATDEELAKGLYDKLANTSHWASDLHSQAVIGLAEHHETKKQYFLCRQSWEGCDLTLVPFLTRQEIVAIIRPRDSGEFTLALVKHHVLFEPTSDVSTPNGLRINDKWSMSMDSGGAFWQAVPMAMTKTF